MTSLVIVRREGGQSLVIGGSSLVILEGKSCKSLVISLSSQVRFGKDEFAHQSLLSKRARSTMVEDNGASGKHSIGASWQ